MVEVTGVHKEMTRDFMKRTYKWKIRKHEILMDVRNRGDCG